MVITNPPAQPDTEHPTVLTMVDWLSHAGREEIEAYAARLDSAKRRQLLEVMLPSLIARLRVSRRILCERTLTSNACTLLPEPDLQAFLISLSAYSPASVLKGYRSRYPQLTCSPKEDYLQDVRTFLKLWESAFLLAAAPRYLDAAPYLASLTKQPNIHAKAPSLFASATRLIDEYSEGFEGNFFANFPLTKELSAETASFLTSLGFLPADTVNRLLKRNRTPELFSLLESIRAATEAIIGTEEVKDSPRYLETLKRLLWDNLAFDEQERFLLEKDVPGNGAIDPEHPTYKAMAFLTDAVTVERILNGSGERDVQAWLLPLVGAQREQALDDLAHFLSTATVPTFLFEPLETESFIKNIRANPNQQWRTEYIESLEGATPAEYWDCTKRLMELISHVF